VSGITNNPSKAKAVTIPFGPLANTTLDLMETLTVKVLTRIGTTADGQKCAGHSSTAGLKLYFDGADRAAGFDVEITPAPLTTYFLHEGDPDFFDATAPTATKAKHHNSPAVNFKNGNPWREIGGWSASITTPGA
jgi:hypothetical protein